MLRFSKDWFQTQHIGHGVRVLVDKIQEAASFELIYYPIIINSNHLCDWQMTQAFRSTQTHLELRSMYGTCEMAQLK